MANQLACGIILNERGSAMAALEGNPPAHLEWSVISVLHNPLKGYAWNLGYCGL